MTFTEGTEKWINYAMMPANNILFPKNHELDKFTVGQCHPKGHKITVDDEYYRSKFSFKCMNFQVLKIMVSGNQLVWKKEEFLKNCKVNENYGTEEWTNIRINFKNSKKPDGKLKVWIDEKLAYDYEGPTNWGKKKHKGNFTQIQMLF